MKQLHVMLQQEVHVYVGTLTSWYPIVPGQIPLDCRINLTRWLMGLTSLLRWPSRGTGPVVAPELNLIVEAGSRAAT
jgi:hypothetical protein